MARDNISGLTYLTIGDEPALIERDLAERAIIIVADIVRLNPSLIDNVSHVVKDRVDQILRQGCKFSAHVAKGGNGRSKDLTSSLVSAAGTSCQDLELEGHLNRVGVVSYNIANVMGMDNPAKNRVRLGARLHDLGKLDREMHRIMGEENILSSERKAKIRLHPQIGARVAEYFEFPEEITNFILKHHFRADGSGYPNQNGAILTPEVGILGVADALDSMIKPRPGKEIKNIPEALQEIRDGSGGHFHPEAVQALSKVAIQSIYR
ncbi:hypothetical protein COY05_00075 [Candidatus Peregrinibacteria bacterium CG_4_10_14_0_2_um_filter_38_24]|nr:MAG: hypothetical protein COY05_00075 [Candidatus Peregrinibacteria bacterium CG_4_10_14_0_2_um_filter_38_24]PJC39164.1 MAG: hypothetical protein CO044_01210 [Candidatus Peregrinibacteria bacterium CG_4_9_14_0_2_um_filter_38_9]